MWGAFDRGEYSKEFIVVERFRLFLERAGLQADPVRCNKIHLERLKTNTQLMPNALDVCHALAQEHRLYIVTNAVAAVQKARLAAPGDWGAIRARFRDGFGDLPIRVEVSAAVARTYDVSRPMAL